MQIELTIGQIRRIQTALSYYGEEGNSEVEEIIENLQETMEAEHLRLQIEDEGELTEGEEEEMGQQVFPK